MERYELIIVGGGMAGLTLLSSIRPATNKGLRVALVDPAPKPADFNVGSPSFDDRATALSAHTLQVLENLKIEDLEPSLSSITEIEVSDRGHAGFHQMKAQKQGFSRFGAVIANSTMGSLLWKNVHQLPVAWQFDNQVTAITPQKDGHELHLSHGNSIFAKQIVMCDGGRSGLHKKLGFSTIDYSFDACARVACVKTTQNHNGTAFERFTESGPIALLPFGAYSALVWTVPNNLKNSLPKDRESSINWLNQHFGQRLGRIEDISSWAEYPLIEKQLPTTTAHGFMALGNAAATLHPVAGQGFNLGIRGIARTADLINNVYLADQLLPDFTQFNDMADVIALDQARTVTASRVLINLFASKSPLVQLARGIGLNSLDRHSNFSKGFALAGMGLLENAPTMA